MAKEIHKSDITFTSSKCSENEYYLFRNNGSEVAIWAKNGDINSSKKLKPEELKAFNKYLNNLYI